jgi:hypothetical protein
MQLLIMQFSPTSCHFIPLRFKYSPKHPVLKHPHTFESPLKKTVYFSDGSAAKYKNRKNLLSITCHNEDLGVPEE